VRAYAEQSELAGVVESIEERTDDLGANLDLSKTFKPNTTSDEIQSSPETDWTIVPRDPSPPSHSEWAVEEVSPECSSSRNETQTATSYDNFKSTSPSRALMSPLTSEAANSVYDECGNDGIGPKGDAISDIGSPGPLFGRYDQLPWHEEKIFEWSEDFAALDHAVAPLIKRKAKKRKKITGALHHIRQRSSIAELSVSTSSTSPRTRHSRNISELSSDSQHLVLGECEDSLGMPISEVDDKSDATQFELNARRLRGMPTPEMPASTWEVEAQGPNMTPRKMGANKIRGSSVSRSRRICTISVVRENQSEITRSLPRRSLSPEKQRNVSSAIQGRITSIASAMSSPPPRRRELAAPAAYCYAPEDDFVAVCPALSGSSVKISGKQENGGKEEALFPKYELELADMVADTL
jgi:hypothetical protein